MTLRGGNANRLSRKRTLERPKASNLENRNEINLGLKKSEVTIEAKAASIIQA
jgi:hypothetical protein